MPNWPIMQLDVGRSGSRLSEAVTCSISMKVILTAMADGHGPSFTDCIGDHSVP